MSTRKDLKNFEAKNGERVFNLYLMKDSSSNHFLNDSIFAT